MVGRWRALKYWCSIIVHRWAVQVGLQKLRAIYILICSFMRWCLACLLFISFFVTDSDSFIILLYAERSCTECAEHCTLEFFHRINQKLVQVKQWHAASTHVNWMLADPRTFHSTNVQPSSQLMPTPNRILSRAASEQRICYLRFQIILRIRVGLGAVTPNPNLFACKWPHSARLNEFLAYLHHLHAKLARHWACPHVDVLNSTWKTKS